MHSYLSPHDADILTLFVQVAVTNLVSVVITTDPSVLRTLSR